MIWATDSPFACPLSGRGHRSSYATNAGAVDGRLQVRAIYNTLP